MKFRLVVKTQQLKREGRGRTGLDLSQDPIPIEIAVGTVGPIFAERLEPELGRPGFEFFVRNLMAIARRLALIVAEPQQAVSGFQMGDVDLLFEHGVDLRPFDDPPLEAWLSRELPGREREDAAGCEAIGCSAQQGETPIPAGYMVHHAHHRDQCEGAGGKS